MGWFRELNLCFFFLASLICNSNWKKICIILETENNLFLIGLVSNSEMFCSYNRIKKHISSKELLNKKLEIKANFTAFHVGVTNGIILLEKIILLFIFYFCSLFHGSIGIKNYGIKCYFKYSKALYICIKCFKLYVHITCALKKVS